MLLWNCHRHPTKSWNIRLFIYLFTCEFVCQPFWKLKVSGVDPWQSQASIWFRYLGVLSYQNWLLIKWIEKRGTTFSLLLSRSRVFEVKRTQQSFPHHRGLHVDIGVCVCELFSSRQLVLFFTADRCSASLILRLNIWWPHKKYSQTCGLLNGIN